MAVTSSVFFALLLWLSPAPESQQWRYYVAAEALAIAHAEALPKWPRSPIQLAAFQLAIIRRESNMTEGVHDGTILGAAGETCVMQLHETNGFWQRYAEKLSDLGGTTLEATLRCVRAGTATIVWAANRALSQRYFRFWREASFSAYHLGGRCWASPERFSRAKLMRSIEARIHERMTTT
jgi:hypothetical protein